ncbi:hypothetical protein GDO81_013878 [Engystomops pustulosus]|uniref:Uncharacterized protein n=1 Tax=Engystomops pustulosus TaxID=76066 RepID=A0AAV7B6B9_ENGPU|nr:hypothetical protein GDO81_013878 [Engystomops pustulosus]
MQNIISLTINIALNLLDSSCSKSFSRLHLQKIISHHLQHITSLTSNTLPNLSCRTSSPCLHILHIIFRTPVAEYPVPNCTHYKSSPLLQM